MSGVCDTPYHLLSDEDTICECGNPCFLLCPTGRINPLLPAFYICSRGHISQIGVGSVPNDGELDFLQWMSS
jgi:hypothetical protein